MLIVLPRIPSDMLHTSSRTAEKFAQSYDRHGDSFYEDTTVEELKKVFNKIEEQVSIVARIASVFCQNTFRGKTKSNRDIFSEKHGSNVS